MTLKIKLKNSIIRNITWAGKKKKKKMTFNRHPLLRPSTPVRRWEPRTVIATEFRIKIFLRRLLCTGDTIFFFLEHRPTGCWNCRTWPFRNRCNYFYDARAPHAIRQVQGLAVLHIDTDIGFYIYCQVYSTVIIGRGVHPAKKTRGLFKS